MIEEAAVVTNPDLLNEAGVPPDIPARDPQIQEHAACLSPALKKKKPFIILFSVFEELLAGYRDQYVISRAISGHLFQPQRRYPVGS